MNLKRLLPLLIVPLLLTACPSGANRTKNGPDLRNLPREIRSGEQGPFHVQGIAVDLERGYIYFSFTTKLLKMDFEGNLIGSVDGMTGHLGCLTMNPADGRVYGSLEYKDDAIGDPMVNEYHIYAMNLATPEEVKTISDYALRVNEILAEFLSHAKIELIDFKLEFGRLPDGTIILADEISPDTCRFWDSETGEKLDKDRFRRDLGNVAGAYKEILRRLLGL